MFRNKVQFNYFCCAFSENNLLAIRGIFIFYFIYHCFLLYFWSLLFFQQFFHCYRVNCVICFVCQDISKCLGIPADHCVSEPEFPSVNLVYRFSTAFWVECNMDLKHKTSMLQIRVKVSKIHGGKFHPEFVMLIHMT